MATWQDKANDALNAALSSLTGSRLIGVIAGVGTGSVVSFHFGELKARERPLSNLHLDERLRLGEGSRILLVECAWRLDGADEVLCSSQDDNAAGGPMLLGLASLYDGVVDHIEVEAPGYDLKVDFTEGQTLRCFCDNAGADTGADNYSLFLSGEPTWVVGARSILRTEG